MQGLGVSWNIEHSNIDYGTNQYQGVPSNDKVHRVGMPELWNAA
jgi:hypothetical protein